MAKGDYGGEGTGTLPVSGAGATSTVAATVTGAASDSLVLITPTNSVSDAQGEFGAYVSAVATNTVTLTCTRAQLPTAMTFQIVAFDGS